MGLYSTGLDTKVCWYKIHNKTKTEGPYNKSRGECTELENALNFLVRDCQTNDTKVLQPTNYSKREQIIQEKKTSLQLN